ncbi:DUF938 domain-containing protein [Enterovirga sp. CN4-39]|uniref:DUF938 domain-containing protein n=1 Tax=Enterovirga sp. CN4-39 TaxID=3400910 RepID=UPI003C10C2F3
MSNLALSSAAVTRNREPILAVLRDLLPGRGTVLEIASGTGEHAAYFAGHLPGIVWQPSDRDPDALASIATHRRAAGVPNLMAALQLDASSGNWPVAPSIDAVVSINMVHISPWSATVGLFTNAARLLASDGVLFLYGPYREAGRPTAPSNEAFDFSLKARDPEWGLRDLGAVRALGEACGLRLAQRVEMPANNLSLVFRRKG